MIGDLRLAARGRRGAAGAARAPCDRVRPLGRRRARRLAQPGRASLGSRRSPIGGRRARRRGSRTRARPTRSGSVTVPSASTTVTTSELCWTSAWKRCSLARSSAVRSLAPGARGVGSAMVLAAASAPGGRRSAAMSSVRIQNTNGPTWSRAAAARPTVVEQRDEHRRRTAAAVAERPRRLRRPRLGRAAALHAGAQRRQQRSAAKPTNQPMSITAARSVRARQRSGRRSRCPTTANATRPTPTSGSGAPAIAPVDRRAQATCRATIVMITTSPTG